MAGEQATAEAVKYPPLAENTYIGAFLVGIGYYAAKNNREAPVSALLQQTGADPWTGDLALGLSGRNYLFEFKRQGNTEGLDKEAVKSAALWTTLARDLLPGGLQRDAMLAISKSCHLFSESGITWERKSPPPWNFQPYLQRFAAPNLAEGEATAQTQPPCRLDRFIQSHLFASENTAGQAMNGASGPDFELYLSFLRTALAGSTTPIGGLVININEAGQVTPVILPNIADISLEKGMLLFKEQPPFTPNVSAPKPRV
ncbi:hypothetical protein AB6Q56_22020 [Dechloromonas sp. ARDL1]|uniref:hypothetical protein n=1 Tax=Dechloromonas sp. ARDL1 TaxID=3322121 RepID=UPI003DA785EB